MTYIVKHKKGYALTQEDVKYYFDRLDEMRDDGLINMFCAPKEIQHLTEGPLDEAIWIVQLWMKFQDTGELEGAM